MQRMKCLAVWLLILSCLHQTKGGNSAETPSHDPGYHQNLSEKSREESSSESFSKGTDSQKLDCRNTNKTTKGCNPSSPPVTPGDGHWPYPDPEQEQADAERVPKDTHVPDAERVPKDTHVPDAERVPKDTHVPDAERVPKDTHVPDAERVPKDTHVPDAERVPKDTHVPDAERVPKDTHVPDAERVPKDTHVPDAERVPKDTHVPDAERVPKDTHVPDAEKAPKDTHVPDAEKAPKDIHVPDAERVPKDTHVPDAEKAPKDTHVPDAERVPKDTHVPDAEKLIEDTNKNLSYGNYKENVRALMHQEEVLKNLKVTKTTFLSVNNTMVFLHEPIADFRGLDMYASDTEVRSGTDVTNRKMSVHLPEELDVGKNDTVVFCTIHLPHGTALNDSDKLYNGRLIGLSVSGKNISGLQERVNITINITTNINKTQEPRCVFLNTSTNAFSTDGCLTLWERGQDNVICSCDHLTYFGVLMVSVSEKSLSSKDQEILSYITIIGCSISLFALIVTVLIFITNRKLREEDSKKIHISLAVALILLNIHFLPSEAVAAASSTPFCLYMALGLHYSLLATFIWMALEGLHLYLLLVKVFNIYVKRYLLKLSVVGWGLPAVIVSVVVIIDRGYYGRAPLDASNSNSTAICYITNYRVKTLTTVGVFGLMFLFNAVMFGVTARWLVGSPLGKKSGQSERSVMKRQICTLHSLLVLLGITWGLVFFSFGHLATFGLYLFCILNSLQGFFIFIYFFLFLKITKDSDAKLSSKTQTTSTKT